MTAREIWTARPAVHVRLTIRQAARLRPSNRGVDALSEPVVDFGEYRARFVAAAGITEQSGEAHSGAEFAEAGRLPAI